MFFFTLIVYLSTVFLQIFRPRRLMAHVPVKWCFTLIHVKTVLLCHGAIQKQLITPGLPL